MTDALTTACLESLECPICLNIFTEPKQLSCGHTFCAGCVAPLVKISQTRSVVLGGDAAAAQHVILCPECRVLTSVPSDGLKTNYRLLALVEKMSGMRLDDRDKCNTCEKLWAADELFICKTCEGAFQTQVWICGTCAVKHHKDHRVVETATKEERDAAAATVRKFASQGKETGRELVSLFERSFNMCHTILEDFDASFEQYCATKSVSKDELKAALEKAETLRERYTKATEAAKKANNELAEVLTSCQTAAREQGSSDEQAGLEADVDVEENRPSPKASSFSLDAFPRAKFATVANFRFARRVALEAPVEPSNTGFGAARGGRRSVFAGRGAGSSVRVAVPRLCFTCGSTEHLSRACPDVRHGGARYVVDGSGEGAGNLGLRQGTPDNRLPPAFNGQRRSVWSDDDG